MDLSKLIADLISEVMRILIEPWQIYFRTHAYETSIWASGVISLAVVEFICLVLLLKLRRWY